MTIFHYPGEIMVVLMLAALKWLEVEPKVE